MLVLLLTSCGTAQGGQGADASSGSGKKDQASESAEAGTASPASLVDPASLSPEAGIFSKKDLKSDYDASSAGKITWDENAQTAGGGMTAEGGRVLITEEGTYILSGSSGNGQVIVEIDKESKVQLVLAGVTLKNPAGPCILVRSADKVIVTTIQKLALALDSSNKNKYYQTKPDQKDPVYRDIGFHSNNAGSNVSYHQRNHKAYDRCKKCKEHVKQKYPDIRFVIACHFFKISFHPFPLLV